MLESLLHFSIKNRWLVVILTAVVAAVGFFRSKKLPIDAVPDITNNQVQINAVAPEPVALRGREAGDVPDGERARGHPRAAIHAIALAQRVLAGDGGLRGRRGHLLRAPASGERLGEAGGSLPPGVEPVMGPIATGLGEVYMYTVEYEHPHGKGARSRTARSGGSPMART
jgi:cobalt-zinc-cadmium resistance protein CzcA